MIRGWRRKKRDQMFTASIIATLCDQIDRNDVALINSQSFGMKRSKKKNEITSSVPSSSVLEIEHNIRLEKNTTRVFGIRIVLKIFEDGLGCFIVIIQSTGIK